MLRAQEAEPSGIGEHAVAACRQVCQRTNVPKNRCTVAVSSRTAPLGKRRWASATFRRQHRAACVSGRTSPVHAKLEKARRHGLDRCAFSLIHIRRHEVKGPGLAVAGLAVADGAPLRRASAAVDFWMLHSVGQRLDPPIGFLPTRLKPILGSVEFMSVKRMKSGH